MGYDSRDAERSRGQWYKSFDQDRMTIAVALLDDDWEDEGDEEEIEFPATFKVCKLLRTILKMGLAIARLFRAHTMSTK